MTRIRRLLFGLTPVVFATFAYAQTFETTTGTGFTNQSDFPGMGEALVVQAPDGADRVDISINVPQLVIVGEDVFEDTVDIEIDVPQLVIVGEDVIEDTVDIKIDVPQLVIVGEEAIEDTVNIEIDVPQLVIVGREEEQETDGTPSISAQDTGAQPSETTTPALPENAQPETEDVPPATARCHGTYTMHAGQGQGTASGLTMPVGRTMTLPATIENQECGQSLDFAAQGQSVRLEPTENLGEYSGTINLGDGPMRTIVLVCGEDLNLRGALVARDTNLRIARPLWLIRQTDQNPLECND